MYDETNYGIEIKYSDIFGSVFTGTSHPVCDSSNTFLKLSSTTNAHAEKIGLGSYGYSVCYGDLKCEYRDVCLAGEESIVTISGDTNAHLGISGYATKVCCKSGCPPGQESCPGSPVNIDPENPGCCLAGYECSFGECVEQQEECYEYDTRGNYMCFSDDLYNHPYDCLGLEGGPRSDKSCCYGCTQGWDYNCWAVIEIY